MRILLLAQFYPPIVGGEERHVRNLAAALSERGHEVTVGTLWFPGAQQTEWDGKVRVVRLRGTLQRAGALFSDSERRHAPPFPDPELVQQLARLMRSVRPAIVHAHNWIVNAYLPLRPFFAAPLLQTLHDYGLVCAKKNRMTEGRPCAGPAIGRCLPCAADHYGAMKGMVTALAARGAAAAGRRLVDRYLAVSRAVAEGNDLAGIAQVVPNFVPDSIGEAVEAHPLTAELPATPFLLFVGDLNHQKGVPTLLEAYRRLRDAPPLVLIGRRFPEIAEPLPPGVRLLSKWPHAAVLGAWQRCLFGLAPSTWPEPCATVVMEGMAFGKPMIVTDTGGMPDIVEDGGSGLLVSPGDPAELAAAMQRLVDDAALRQRLGDGARLRVARFKAAAVVARIEAAYAELLSPSRRAQDTLVTPAASARDA